MAVVKIADYGYAQDCLLISKGDVIRRYVGQLPEDGECYGIPESMAYAFPAFLIIIAPEREDKRWQRT